MNNFFKHDLFNPTTFWSLLAAWIVLSLFQTLHFHYYFDQPWLRSLRWSFRDWLLWMITAFYFYCLTTKLLPIIKSQLAASLLLIVAAFITGLVQVLLTIVTDFIMAGLSRPFWEDFFHLYQKRWFQNLLIFTILWVFIHQLFTRTSKQHSVTEKSDSSNTTNRIQVVDGKQQYWLDPNNIYRLEVTGNYICFFTTEGQKIARKTLKSMAEQLGDHGFLKISRFTIVNVKHVKACTKSGTKTQVELTNGDTCNISRRYWNKFKHNMNTTLS